VLAGTNIFGEPGAVLFRRAALADAGGWDARFPYLIDEATYCAVLLRGNLVAVPGPLSAFRVSHSQWTVQLMRAQADQTIGFQRELAAAHPGLLDRRHLLVGSARAHANALGRRMVYRWLGWQKRLGTAAAGGPHDASKIR
jgi:hypothetical protein